MGKKVAVIGISSILLVAMVVAVAVGVTKKSGTSSASPSGDAQVSTSTKAIKAICQPTDYKETCEKSLQNAKNTSDPKELIKAAFQVAVNDISDAVKNSSVLQGAAKDPRTSHALENCKELLDMAIDDLKRSFDKVGDFDVTKMDEYIADLKTWLSGTITYQETCLDGFENTTGDAGEKMRKLLKTSGELTSNGLAMVSEISSVISNLQIPGLSRRLLNLEDVMIEPVTDVKRNLLNLEDVIVKPISVNSRRNLLNLEDEIVVPVPAAKRNLLNLEDDIVVPVPAAKRNLLNLEDEVVVPVPAAKRNLFNIEDDVIEPITMGHKRNLLNLEDEVVVPVPAAKRNLFNIEDDVIEPITMGHKRDLIQVNINTVKPNAVVAQDGSGAFKTITEALKTVPLKNNQTFIILIKAGVYKEYVEVPRKMNNIVFIGEGPLKTRITGNKNFIDGIGTYKTATVAINGDGFVARNIGFENTAGPEKHQAVALRVSGDMAIFDNCHMDAYQDTLYTHSYRQFYRGCTISGTIDFIFGDAAAVFQNCKMVVRKPLENQACMVTAQGRKDHRGTGGLILQNCTITGEPAVLAAKPAIKSYLGRPWKEFSRTIIMQSFIDSNVAPEGWSPWAGTFGLDTLYYAEYANRGPGANSAQRVAWKGIKKISAQEAQTYTAAKFIEGDLWVKPTGVPYESGMLKV